METFNDFNIDGERVCMTIRGNVITFGGRFEETIRWRLHGLSGEYREERIRQAFDFFRNFATLFSRQDWRDVSRCYRLATEQSCASVEYAFWKYWDGKRLKLSKRTHQWVGRNDER